MHRLEGLRFLYVTGKGGVGKSTVSAVLATWLARRGHRVLLTFGADALGAKRLLGSPIDYKPTAISPNFYAAAIDSDISMQEYAEGILKSRRLTSALFHSKVARGFLQGVPGLQAWAFLGKSWFFADPTAPGPRDGSPDFDTVIVDAPATGDSTDILRVPKVIRDVAPRGRLREDADACWAMLHDPKRSAILPVTLLEELPVTETEELIEVVRQDLRLPLGPVIVNQARPVRFAKQARTHLAALASSETGTDTGTTAVEQTLQLASRVALEETQAQGFRSRLDALGLGRIEVPHFQGPCSGTDGLRALADLLTETTLSDRAPI